MLKSLFATRSIAALRAASREQNLKRTLTSFDLIMLGVGVVLGAGIFVVTGRAAAVNAGPAVALSFIVAGLAAALAGLCYSEMAGIMPASGGTYSYVSVTMGEMIAFLIGWDLILEYLLGAAMVAVSWSGYVSAFLHSGLGIALPERWSRAPICWSDEAERFILTGSYINLPAALFVLLVTCVLVVGIRESSRVNTAVVMAKMLAIFLFVLFGIQAINPANWHPFLPPNEGTFGAFGLSGVFRGASMVFLAYIGFDAISTAAQETEDPARDVPRGILGSLSICVGMYVVVSLVLTGVVSYRELNVPHPIAVGIAAIGQRWLTSVVELGAIAGLSSGAIVMLMGQPRIFLAMGYDGLLPAWTTKIHPRYGTPHVSTCVTGVVCAIASGIGPVEVLTELVSLGTLLAFFLVSIGVTVLRYRHPELKRSFRVPFGAWLIPMTSAGIALALIVSMPRPTLERVGMWMLLGVVFYFGYSRRHSRLRHAAITRAA